MAENEKEDINKDVPLLPKLSIGALSRWSHEWEISSGHLEEFLTPAIKVLSEEQPALTPFLLWNIGDEDDENSQFRVLMGGAFVHSLLRTEAVRGSVKIPIVSDDTISSRLYGIVQSNEIPYEQRGKFVEEQIERENPLLRKVAVELLKDFIEAGNMTPNEAADITASAWITYDLLKQQAASDRLSASFPDL